MKKLCIRNRRFKPCFSWMPVMAAVCLLFHAAPPAYAQEHDANAYAVRAAEPGISDSIEYGESREEDTEESLQEGTAVNKENGQETDSGTQASDSEKAPETGESVYTDSQGIIYLLDGDACYVSGYTEDIQSSAAIPRHLETEDSTYAVKGIQPQAFLKCSRLKKIEIPNSVSDIGNGAFSGCRNLSSISVVPVKYSIKKNGKTSVTGIRVSRALLGESDNVRLKIPKGPAAEAAAQTGTDTVTISVQPDSSDGQYASLEYLEFEEDAAKVLSKCGKALKVKLSGTDGKKNYILLDKSRLKKVTGSFKIKLQKQTAADTSGNLKSDLQKALQKSNISKQKALVCQITLSGVGDAGADFVFPTETAVKAGSRAYVYRYSKSRRDFLAVLYHPAAVSSQGNLRLSLNKGGAYILTAEPLQYMCRKLTNTWITESGSTYYLDKNGQPVCGWKKLGQSYYYFDRETGKMASGCTTDGIRLTKSGQADATDAGIQKIQTMIKARNVVLQVTNPQDTLEQKLEKCFRWIFQFPYRRYRRLAPIYRQAGWEVIFANDIFDRHQGCCVSDASATAFLFHECGCKTVYVATDTGHAWVELNGRVYDPLFAEARGFDNYYNRPYEGYGMRAVVKHKI